MNRHGGYIRPRRASVLAAVLVPLVLSVIPPAARATPTVHEVAAATNYYEPSVVHAAAGDTIRWRVTEGSHDVATYGGNASFQSSQMTRASLPYEHAYQGGVILYRCTPHSSISSSGPCVGMCGAITDRTSAPQAPIITYPTHGAVLDTATVAFAGTGEAWTTVRLTKNAKLLAEALVRADGTWRAGVRLQRGNHTVTARAYTVDGTPSDSSATVTFNVSTESADTIRPVVRVISDSVLISVGEARLDGLATDNVAVAAVWVEVYDWEHRLVATAPATCPSCPAPSVAWTARIALPPGLYMLYAVAEDTGSPANRSVPAEPTHVLVLPAP